MTAQLLHNIITLSQRVHSKINDKFEFKKQTNTILVVFNRNIGDLLVSNVSIKVIFLSLFHAWVRLETILNNIAELRSVQIIELSTQIINFIKSIIIFLPDYQPTKKIEKLNNKLDALKLTLPEKIFNPVLSENELTNQVTAADKKIKAMIDYFLHKSLSLEIIADAVFCECLRLSTLHASISEDYYLKMNYNFKIIINSVRKYLPKLLS